MKAILGYAFMITMSTLLLILGVAGFFVEGEPVWLATLLMIIGFFNLFGWVAGAQYNLNNSKEGDDKDAALDR